MQEKFFLGNKEKLGDIDFSKIRSGLSKKDLGIEEGSVLSSIFDSINTNNTGNSKGKLDKTELNQFIQLIQKLAKKDNTLSEKEAGKYKINGEKIDKSGKELLNFLTKLAQTTDDIVSVETQGNKEIVTYKNGDVYEEENFDDGSKFTKKTSGKKTTEKVFDANGNKIRETDFEEGKITYDRYVEYDESGTPVSSETISKSKLYDYEKFPQGIDGSIHKKYKYDKEKQNFVEIESTCTYIDETTNTVINQYNNYTTGDYENLEVVDGLCRSHLVRKNGQVTFQEYDEQGCLLGYVVQPGDTVESIAEKFGVSKDLLVRANSQSNFLVLDKIRIPKQFAIDDPALKNMNTFEEAWEKAPKVTQTWLDPASGEEWQEELVVVKDNLKHGWKVARDKSGEYYAFTKDNKYIPEEEVQDQLYWDSLTKIHGELSDGSKIQLGVIKSGLPSGRKCARDREGNVYIVSHDNKILSDEYVAKTDLWDNSEKILGRTKSKDGSWTESEYVVVKDGLKNGRKIVMDKDLNYHYMDANGNICDEEVAEEEALESIHNDPKIAMKATLMILKEMYKNARAAFDKQIREQGWTANVADSVSIIWGSENRAEVVAKELDNYAKQIQNLEACLQSGDFDEFKKIFKALFDVDFRPLMIAEYVKNPSEHNYINAFGVDNNIAQRVAKYNESQNFGSSIVKTVTSAIGGILATLALPYTGGASGVIIGAAGASISSLLVGISDRASSDVGLRESDLEEIAKSAAWDGVSVLAGGAAGKFAKTVITGASKAAAMARTAVNIAADTTVGIAQEYAETGTISAEGVISNAILSGAGSAISSLHFGKRGAKHLTYSKMNAEELFTEYKRLHLKITSEDIDLKLKNNYIKQIKEIEGFLKNQGYVIENLKIKSIQTENTHLIPIKTDEEAKVFVKQELKNKLGNDLYNLHEMVVNSINNVKTIKDFEKLKTIIVTKFKEFTDVMLNLLTQLIEKAKQLNLNIKDAELNLIKVKAQVGKKLAKLYNKILNSIDAMSTEKKYDKIFQSIQKNFANSGNILTDLIEKLNKKAASIGLKHKVITTPYDNLIPVDQSILNVTASKYKGKVLNCNYSEQSFKSGDIFVVDLASNKHTQLSLGPLVSLDLSEPRLAKMLKNLKEGESFTIGSFEGNAKYKMGSSSNGVSHQHLVVTKKNGVYIFKDTSTYGTKASLNISKPIKTSEVKDMFPNGTIQDSYYINKVHKKDLTLDSTDYKNIAALINKCDGKFRKLWESTFLLDKGRNIDKLAAFAKLIRKHGSFDFYLNMDERTWSVVVNNICQKQNNAVNAIYSYKFNSTAINTALSTHQIYQPTGSYINNLTDYLNTQTINRKITAYRGEQYNASLKNLKLPNGMNAGEVLQSLVKKGASKHEIDNFVNKYLIGNAVKQERFMSTSLDRKFCEDWAKKDPTGHSGSNPDGAILWEIDIPGETKGAFVEDFNIPHMEEYEVLLQRDSYLIITGAHFDDDKNLWIIEAIVRQTPYEQIKKVSEV